MAQNSQTAASSHIRVCHRQLAAKDKLKLYGLYKQADGCVILCDGCCTFVDRQQHFTRDFAIASLQATIYLKDLHSAVLKRLNQLNQNPHFCGPVQAELSKRFYCYPAWHTWPCCVAKEQQHGERHWLWKHRIFGQCCG